MYTRPPLAAATTGLLTSMVATAAAAIAHRRRVGMSDLFDVGCELHHVVDSSRH
jgi:hypothetical protein